MSCTSFAAAIRSPAARSMKAAASVSIAPTSAITRCAVPRTRATTRSACSPMRARLAISLVIQSLAEPSALETSVARSSRSSKNASLRLASSSISALPWFVASISVVATTSAASTSTWESEAAVPSTLAARLSSLIEAICASPLMVFSVAESFSRIAFWVALGPFCMRSSILACALARGPSADVKASVLSASSPAISRTRPAPFQMASSSRSRVVTSRPSSQERAAASLAERPSSSPASLWRASVRAALMSSPIPLVRSSSLRAKPSRRLADQGFALS